MSGAVARPECRGAARSLAELASPRRYQGKVVLRRRHDTGRRPLSACGGADGDGAVSLGRRRLRHLAAPPRVYSPLRLAAARPSGDREVEDAADLRVRVRVRVGVRVRVRVRVRVVKWKTPPT